MWKRPFHLRNPNWLGPDQNNLAMAKDVAALLLVSCLNCITWSQKIAIPFSLWNLWKINHWVSSCNNRPGLGVFDFISKLLHQVRHNSALTLYGGYIVTVYGFEDCYIRESHSVTVSHHLKILLPCHTAQGLGIGGHSESYVWAFFC